MQLLSCKIIYCIMCAAKDNEEIRWTPKRCALFLILMASASFTADATAAIGVEDATPPNPSPLLTASFAGYLVHGMKAMLAEKALGSHQLNDNDTGLHQSTPAQAARTNAGANVLAVGGHIHILMRAAETYLGQRGSSGGTESGEMREVKDMNMRGPDELEFDRWSNFPDGWESYSYYDVIHHFDCRYHSRDQTKELYSLEDWVFFRKQYNEMADSTVDFDSDPVLPTDGYTLTEEGGPPPYYAAHSREGRGRGLFASRDIKEGELVHDGTKCDLMFPNSMAWRRFVFSLPRRMACDVAVWSWSQEIEKERRLFIDPNISSLINSDTNLANVLPKSNESTIKMYATRDIRYGEEILTDYEYCNEGEVVL